MTPLMFIRFRRGIVGETRRSVHLVPAPDGGLATQDMGELVALCGQNFLPDQAELLPMPGARRVWNARSSHLGSEDVASASRLRELIA
ncbi:hypothetical protein OG439_20250 [Amycolatopsis sp. NBC_01307]|uniref:hypothetical protein n=1 Tax=Amycolatopsis sp. NBC_01307 TaxID=2903561 RepID=UPI002E10F253|nr:hypothetical protein OG439_20250 [Amycolatopsis sp. NBC_01307]